MQNAKYLKGASIVDDFIHEIGDTKKTCEMEIPQYGVILMRSVVHWLAKNRDLHEEKWWIQLAQAWYLIQLI